MRIAFYAPLKAPGHPVPSGDRRMARLLVAALRRAGHEVEHASRLRSWDGTGDARRQARIRALGTCLAARLLRGYEFKPTPELWFTYHAYHKAPDWIGPIVSTRLAIPYVVAEPSLAAKQKYGPWAAGHAQTLISLRQASAVLALNPADIAGIASSVAASRLHEIKPFIDTAAFSSPDPGRGDCLPADWRKDTPHLVTVAMMRPGDKLASYLVLADALRRLQGQAWQLVIVGDGKARAAVEKAFGDFAHGRILYAGQLAPAPLSGLLPRCDVFVWPAINEAYGMALLEAQACGVPVVAGRSGGVASIVADSRSGVLVPPGDPAALAQALAAVLDDPPRRRTMGRAARDYVARHHDLGSASAELDRIFRNLGGPTAGP